MNWQANKLNRIDFFLFVSQDVHDQMEDMLEQTNDIMETMGRPYGLPDDVDEDDLEAGKDSLAFCLYDVINTRAISLYMNFEALISKLIIL